MGYLVRCISGNTNQVDHTQYGTIPYADRPTDAFKTLTPIGFDLDQIMQLAWRVKRWKISGTAAWTWTGGSHGSDSRTVVYDPDTNQDPSPPSPFDAQSHLPFKKNSFIATPHYIPDERWLVAAYGPEALYIATTPTGSFRPFFAKYQSFVLGGGNPSLQFPSIYYGGPDGSFVFYPIQYFHIEMDGAINGAGFAVMTSNLAEVGALTNGRGTEIGTLTVLGREVKLYAGVALTGYSGSGTLTLSADFTMEPDKYWPFANSDNFPVYDEDTGAQLVDPFS